VEVLFRGGGEGEDEGEEGGWIGEGGEGVVFRAVGDWWVEVGEGGRAPEVLSDDAEGVAGWGVGLGVDGEDVEDGGAGAAGVAAAFGDAVPVVVEGIGGGAFFESRHVPEEETGDEDEERGGGGPEVDPRGGGASVGVGDGDVSDDGGWAEGDAGEGADLGFVEERAFPCDGVGAGEAAGVHAGDDAERQGDGGEVEGLSETGSADGSGGGGGGGLVEGAGLGEEVRGLESGGGGSWAFGGFFPVRPDAPCGDGGIPCDEAEDGEGEDVDLARGAEFVSEPAEEEGGGEGGWESPALVGVSRGGEGGGFFLPDGGEGGEETSGAIAEEGGVGRVRGGGLAGGGADVEREELCGTVGGFDAMHEGDGGLVLGGEGGEAGVGHWGDG